MAQPEIRPHIVALLCDADFKYRPDTNTWSHRDGRPFSKAEQATAHQCTRAELEEVQAQFTRYREYLRQEQEAPEALQRFLAPFMAQLTEKNLGNAVDLMTQDERAEFDRLLKHIAEPVRPFAAFTF
ncbi:hypothetical protein [Streptomyces justiciae]|uniref:hypothetical protein n=1 Tax=Streptomyces justiciae TaxID=2780140 RepID=UPI0021179F89|nr:hypothetical protein [Streptomyces justiciae]MCW8383405.1 hypothetical protein [Streptomyces justiciae]